MEQLTRKLYDDDNNKIIISTDCEVTYDFFYEDVLNVDIFLLSYILYNVCHKIDIIINDQDFDWLKEKNYFTKKLITEGYDLKNAVIINLSILLLIIFKLNF